MSNRAVKRAHQRLAELFAPEFKILLDEERAALGLDTSERSANKAS
jgi:hypothetical protein